mgnify:CR=1 FL=1
MFPSPAHSLRLLITSCLATFCLLGQAQTEIPPHKAILNSDLKNTLGTQVSDEVIDYLKVTSRGSRDCVVNTIQYGLFGVTIDSYSSRKLGACDPMAYRQLTEASIKAQMNTFDLPTFTQADAVTSYHFHRLLQRPKQIELIYVQPSEKSSVKEMSRFIKQLRLDWVKQNPALTWTEPSVSFDLAENAPTNEVHRIEKSYEVIQQLKAKKKL